MGVQRELLGSLAGFYMSTVLVVMVIKIIELFAKGRSQLRPLQILRQLSVTNR